MEEKRTERLWTYLTATERQAFREYVKHIGTTEATWIRQQILTALRTSAEKDVAET